MSPRRPLKVLSVVGAGRSGTTVLASIFGEIEGFGSAGELRFLWDRGLKQDRPCGCGEPPSRCEVWSTVAKQVLDRLEEHVPGTTVDDVVEAQRLLTRRDGLALALGSRPAATEHRAALELVRHATGLTCSAFADLTGSRVVVDTSKRPVDAAVLAGVADVEHYVVHLVRDPHAVVHSWRRPKTFSAAGETRAIGTRALASTVLRWRANCRDAQVLQRHVPSSRWVRMRYEDFAVRPRQSVEAIVAFMDETGSTPFLDERTVLLGPNHIVAGNPSRFTTGTVHIRLDDEWRTTMPSRDRRAIDVLTLGPRRRYGYESTGRATSGSTVLP